MKLTDVRHKKRKEEESKSPTALQVNSKVLTDRVLESSECPDNTINMFTY